MAQLRTFRATGVIAALVAALAPTACFGLPAGFTDSIFASGLGGTATAMAFAPDGRLFVLQQTGAVRVITGGQLLTTPFLTLTVDSTGERGLLGIAFDPGFQSNRFLYLYYTSPTPAVHNRVSRFTASATNQNVVEPGSELPLMDLENLSGATNHNGGAMHFGSDGKLYIGVGENANSANAETLANGLGKIHRINPDGSIPGDNPFVATPGARTSIWAYGFRNPFTFAVQPGTGKIYINDVGEGSYEEINDLVKGAFYGWPQQEGPIAPGLIYEPPLFYFPHSGGPITGCAITGGAFYNPPVSQFPASYIGQYFFGDLCGGWVRSLTTANAPVDFTTGYSNPVGYSTGPDGALYVLARGTGQVRRIAYAAPQTISVSPASGSGATQVFTFQFSAANGYQDLGVVNILVNPSLDGNNACYLAYSQPLNVLYLVNDDNSGLLPGLTLNGSGSTSNSQCTVNGGGSSVSGAGNTLTLTLSMSFNASFAGGRIFYLAARDSLQANSGWQALGSRDIPGGAQPNPSVTAIAPGHVNGATQAVAVTFTDAAGAADLGIVNVLIHSYLYGNNSCYFAYSRPQNTLYLVGDSGSLLPGITLNGSGSVGNSQCTVSGAGSSAVVNGNNLTLTLNVTMSASYSGNKVIWAAARSLTEVTAGWQAVGTWSAP